jgi:phosphatidylglycerophosphate synthase
MGKTTDGGFRLLPKNVRTASLAIVRSTARPFVRLGISPDALSIIGLCAGAGAGLLIWRGHPLWALGAGLAAGVLDLLDGEVARLTGRTSDFGAFLDSTLDRYSEFFLYAGAAAWLDTRWAYGLASLAFLGSVGVSYSRARAEGLGFSCQAGWMQRGERLTVLGLAIVAGAATRRMRPALVVALAVIALLSNATTVQRIILVRRLARERQESGRTTS